MKVFYKNKFYICKQKYELSIYVKYLLEAYTVHAPWEYILTPPQKKPIYNPCAVGTIEAY